MHSSTSFQSNLLISSSSFPSMADSPISESKFSLSRIWNPSIFNSSPTLSRFLVASLERATVQTLGFPPIGLRVLNCQQYSKQPKKMNSHSKVTDQTPIFIDSSPAISPLAEEMEISMLLTPPGYSIYDGDCFTQPEFDALFAFVMNQITIYCRDNYPKNFLEHEARVKLYMDISRGFKFANVHNLIPKYEDGIPHGPSSGDNHTLRRILQVVD
ncbi:hypothetical protein PGT21_017472 [Puccinia graminis f. sp. tritici]|uniref:Uncharacterized protein n=1 Tax=Puccinia graminis f. sp. tritici TaxID=56615 RepID=A0A5B0M8Q9_PUCGR|nr:hypothetical protein PGT21_024604 [Puccinia graminis f. sp. tritici]KAA1072669.1 hypothetical protein PGTUg99_014589 [Puccinia graminis f. sp. tritici]KAA1076743.1 hypothetical protein PGT21_017472 [Puccinia graminis f. sp. tritici]KAA1105096.1 hypothetical protein PGTUg99_009272 [Puccinia graminis f. sp. tritici]KAA1126913.1 hypothetical protein PGTUg99_031347 [Puccinia graminis f. sp. tritici]